MSDDSNDDMFNGGDTQIVGIDKFNNIYCTFDGKTEVITSRKDSVDALMETQDCWVCGSVANGVHFQATSCAACNAFFRRSVATRRAYICRRGGDCPISKDIRCLCRACRLKKCALVGMNPHVVQPQRGSLTAVKATKRVKRVVPKVPKMEAFSPMMASTSTSSYDDYKASSTSESNASTPLSQSSTTRPILEPVMQAYEKLLSRRRLLYNRTNLKDMMNGVEPTYQPFKSADHHRLESSAVRIWLANTLEFFNSFGFMKEFTLEDRCLSFKTFLQYFIGFEKYYLTCKMGGLKQNRIYCQDYVYIDLNEMEKTQNPESVNAFPHTVDSKMIDPKSMHDFNLPDCKKALEVLVKPMDELQMDDTEFMCCAIHLLFNCTLFENPVAKAMGQKIRNQLYQEWFHYYTTLGYTKETAAIRMGNVLLIAPILVEFVNHVKVNFHMLRVFGAGNAYDKVLDEVFL